MSSESKHLTLEEMQTEAHDNSVAHGFWDPGQENIGMKLALIHSEISEALEEYRVPGADLSTVRYESTGLKPFTRLKPEGFPVELADAVIRILDLADHLSIDLSTVIQDKLFYNRGRPPMHGKAL